MDRVVANVSVNDVAAERDDRNFERSPVIPSFIRFPERQCLKKQMKSVEEYKEKLEKRSLPSLRATYRYLNDPCHEEDWKRDSDETASRYVPGRLEKVRERRLSALVSMISRAETALAKKKAAAKKKAVPKKKAAAKKKAVPKKKAAAAKKKKKASSKKPKNGLKKTIVKKGQNTCALTVD
jgi:hypothetical protein